MHPRFTCSFCGDRHRWSRSLIRPVTMITRTRSLAASCIPRSISTTSKANAKAKEFPHKSLNCRPSLLDPTTATINLRPYYGMTVSAYSQRRSFFSWISKNFNSNQQSHNSGNSHSNSKECEDAQPTDNITIPKTLQTVADWIQESAANSQGEPNILVLCGAGVSVAAGLPDFRSPGTGLYDNLQRYNLPYAEAIFDLEYYQTRPQAFMSLAKDIWPGLQQEASQTTTTTTTTTTATTTETTFSHPPPSPTLAHSFLALLEQKNLLRRCYTQNIDGLEVLGGVPPSRMVECHGHFRTARCIECGAKADIEQFKQYVLEGATEPPICDTCRTGYVKPDIVFFGEMLPDKMHMLLGQDLAACRLLIIMGTSLQVAPVSTIPNKVPPSCRRVLLNRELVGNLRISVHSNQNLHQQRDLFHAGDCDDSALTICRALGWEGELWKQNEATRMGLD